MSARRLVARVMTVAVLAGLACVLVLVALPDSAGVERAVAHPRSAPPRAAGRTARKAVAKREPRVHPMQADVTIAAGGPSIQVPRSFLGLSTEYWSMPVFERHLALFERVLGLIHVPGGGPPVLRIGGDSADTSLWRPRRRHLPRWAFALTAKWLRRTSVVIRGTGAKVILDLNAVTGTPTQAAQWARTAETAFPRASIIGFEIGNEPDIFTRSVLPTNVASFAAAALPNYISASAYVQDFQSFAGALAAVAQQVPLIGPALANPDTGWISSLISGSRARLGMISAHRYPYSACLPASSAAYPTLARVLSEQATAGMARSVKAALRLAHRAGLPFRLTELNSVTCGGVRGVSNTFATALWAPDALFELARAGVDGVNIHVRAHAINAAFDLRHGLRARPLLYGMALFARALGPHARLVDVKLRTRHHVHLKVWAVTVDGDRLRVLLINKSHRLIDVRLALPATSPARVQRLLAPSAASRTGVTLEGQRLDSSGHWWGKPVNQTIKPGPHGYTLALPRTSAALLNVYLGPKPTG